MDPKIFMQPLQQWLLGQGRCVACGKPLSEGHVKKNGFYKVTCQCQRIYIKESNGYRRALQQDEVEEGVL